MKIRIAERKNKKVAVLHKTATKLYFYLSCTHCIVAYVYVYFFAHFSHYTGSTKSHCLHTFGEN